MQDYQGNSNKAKKQDIERPPKNIIKVVSGEVVVPKKGIAQKFRETFFEANLTDVSRYVVSDVLIPAAKNMLWDAFSQGGKRWIFGSQVIRSAGFGQGPRFTYNTPVNRMASPLSRGSAPPIEIGPRRSSQYGSTDVLLSTREEGESVLEHMSDILDQYQVVSVGDFKALVGLQSNHTDEKWGWTFLTGSTVRQTRDGFLIELPQPEAL